MRQIKIFWFALMGSVLFVACGDSKKDNPAEENQLILGSQARSISSGQLIELEESKKRALAGLMLALSNPIHRTVFNLDGTQENKEDSSDKMKTYKVEVLQTCEKSGDVKIEGSAVSSVETDKKTYATREILSDLDYEFSDCSNRQSTVSGTMSANNKLRADLRQRNGSEKAVAEGYMLFKLKATLDSGTESQKHRIQIHGLQAGFDLNEEVMREMASISHPQSRSHQTAIYGVFLRKMSCEGSIELDGDSLNCEDALRTGFELAISESLYQMEDEEPAEKAEEEIGEDEQKPEPQDEEIRMLPNPRTHVVTDEETDPAAEQVSVEHLKAWGADKALYSYKNEYRLQIIVPRQIGEITLIGPVEVNFYNLYSDETRVLEPSSYLAKDLSRGGLSRYKEDWGLSEEHLQTVESDMDAVEAVSICKIMIETGVYDVNVVYLDEDANQYIFSYRLTMDKPRTCEFF